MNILILHRIPYHKIDYHRGIDHERHQVTYIGTAASLGNIPPALRCRRIERPGHASAAEEVGLWLQGEPQTFDRVLSLSEYELLDAARIRARFDIPGPLPQQVEKVRNKALMKQAVAEAGLRVPRFLPLEALLGGASPWSGRTVLKPLYGASSEDVVIFESPEQLLAAVSAGQTGAKALDRDPAERHRFEAEEFVEGPILHFDGLVRDGRLLMLKASRYIGTCLDYARGSPLGSIQIQLAEGIEKWVTAVLWAVEIRHGSFHLEAIQGPQGPVFLEVANRVGGADVVDTFEMATGIHLPSEELKILLGEAEAPLPAPVSSDDWFGWFVFPGHHLGAAHCRLEHHEVFATSPLMVRWNQLSENRPLPKGITYQALECPAAGVVRARSSEEATAFIEEMFRTLRIVTVPAQEALAS